MPAKPKRGTLPSFDGCLVDQTFYVCQPGTFISAHPHTAPHSCGVRKPACSLRLRVPHISAHPHMHTQRYPPLYSKKILNKKIPRIRARTCERRCQCADVRKCAEIGKSASFLHLRVFSFCAAPCADVRETFSACPPTREMLSHARKAL